MIFPAPPSEAREGEGKGEGQRRRPYLEAHGFRVLRFWNSDVLSNRDGVALTILTACGGEREANSDA